MCLIGEGTLLKRRRQEGNYSRFVAFNICGKGDGRNLRGRTRRPRYQRELQNDGNDKASGVHMRTANVWHNRAPSARSTTEPKDTLLVPTNLSLDGCMGKPQQ